MATLSAPASLRKLAAELARTHEQLGFSTPVSGSGKALRQRLERDVDRLLDQLATIDVVQLRQLRDAEWLLDNAHVVREALSQIELNLPRRYYRQLKHVEIEESAAPRALELAREILRQSDVPMDMGWLEQGAMAYQSVSPLTLGELWALPTLLRAAVLEQLCASGAAWLTAGETAVDRSTETAGQIAGCIISLREIAAFNWPDLVERVSYVDRRLRRDPSGDYSRMDFATRNWYRSGIERISSRCSVPEWDIAAAAVELSKIAESADRSPELAHVGYFIVGAGRRELEHYLGRRPGRTAAFLTALSEARAPLYLCAVLLLPVVLAGGIAWRLSVAQTSIWLTVGVGLAVLVSTTSLTASLCNWLITLSCSPRLLPKLDFEKRIPSRWRAVVAVPAMLSSKHEIDELLGGVEINYLGNPERALTYALLTDFPDADSEECATDQDLLNYATAGVDHLNGRHGDARRKPFCLLHRARLWNENEQCWMGWERKRGKLNEFNRWLLGAEDTTFAVMHGGVGRLKESRLVITLDADTHMPVGAAARLVGAMAHPLNRPVFDERTGRVRSGYTVIQPRIDINPSSANATWFSRLYAGDVSLDLYTHAVSDAYQDAFGEAVFAGKGIYDVVGFERSLDGRIPTNSVLSHDLLEGLYGRAGLASDIALLEDYPTNLLTFLRRSHRWIRGDWQLLPWIFGSGPGASGSARPFRPGLIGRWKLVDNVRRSLLAPALLLLLLLAWTVLPGDPFWWTAAVALVPGLPILMGIVAGLRRGIWRWGTLQSSAQNLVSRIAAELGRWFLSLVFLPGEAVGAADAIGRSLYRLTISRRRMLEWTTAAQAARQSAATSGGPRLWWALWPAPACAALAGALVIGFQSGAQWLAAPFLACWLLAPALAQWLGRDRNERPAPLLEKDEIELRRLARQTWRFFEDQTGPDTGWLPPDNIQLAPTRHLAMRTSPTNIGLAILSTISAFELGYLGLQDLVARLSNTLDSIRRIPGYRGHLYNWYSLASLTPLEPRYVSTVDSGNFVASLIAARQALLAALGEAISGERVRRGLLDCLDVVAAEVSRAARLHESAGSLDELNAAVEAAKESISAGDWIDRLSDLHEHCDRIDGAFLAVLESDGKLWTAEDISTFRGWSQRLRQQLRSAERDRDDFLGWRDLLRRAPLDTADAADRSDEPAELVTTMPSLDDLAPMLERAERIAGDIEASAGLGVEDLRERLENARQHSARTRKDIGRLCDTMQQMIHGTDFRFLYDGSRHLFHIGYNVSTGELDGSYYDLLASEARLASFVAVAKNNVPVQHWVHLGRPLTRVRGMRVLLSWSATSFEYLMPRLLMRSPESGLLYQSCRAAVQQQKRYARSHRIPWGMSESGYYQFDRHGVYQYRAFGVPRLGFKWDQRERLVVSPYASILGLPFDARAVVDNLRSLRDYGVEGPYGFCEAVDFGHGGTGRQERPRVVRSYMAHHQGMILAAICNALTGDRLLTHFHNNPHIMGAEYLLYEQLPKSARTQSLGRLPGLLRGAEALPLGVETWPVPETATALTVLSNGHLSAVVSSDGGGSSSWNGQGVLRWRADSEGSSGGSVLYFKDLDSGALWSLGAAATRPRQTTVRFGPHEAEFTDHRHELLTRVHIAVAPHADIEIRRVTLTNESDEPRRMLIASYGEVLLGDIRDDRRHPAFSKLFVESRLIDENETLLFRRHPRDPDLGALYLAHTVIGEPVSEYTCYYETDRRRFLGRHGSLRAPASLTADAPNFSSSVGFTLDPICSIGLTVEIAPRATVHLAFLTSVGRNQRRVLETLAHYRSLGRVAWAIDQAKVRSERELQHFGLSTAQVRESFALLTAVTWPTDQFLPPAGVLRHASAVQDTLWRHGISGDRPIVLVKVADEEDLSVATELIHAQTFWNARRVPVDLVFIDESRAGYAQPTADQLRRAAEQHLQELPGGERGLLQIISGGHLDPTERNHLLAAARVYLDFKHGRLAEQLEAPGRAGRSLPAFVPQPSAPLTRIPIEAAAVPDGLLFANGFGGFSSDGKEYIIATTADHPTPAPWSNVLANPSFGALVTESGGGFTWYENSSEYRLSPWHNDPVTDCSGEALYLRDEETGHAWCPCKGPRPDDGTYVVRHGAGYTRFDHNSDGLEQSVTVFVDCSHAIKFVRVELRNRWPRVRRLTATYAVEWVLGHERMLPGRLLVPEHDHRSRALCVRNAYDRIHPDRVAFLGSDMDPHGVTTDALEFLGHNRSWQDPAGLSAVGLSNYTGPANEPMAAYCVHINLQPGESKAFHFALGIGESRSEALDLAQSCRDAQWLDARWNALREFWDKRLDRCVVRTPDRALDLLVNRWLPYQTLVSRVWARAAYYQTAGGYGFRDQLQDVSALLPIMPDVARSQILTAAAQQFEEGDVLHWWHPNPNRGVRTRCSDDLLWLPFVTAAYVATTGDLELLSERVAYLSAPILEPDEQERYAEYASGPVSGSVYEHCFRAIDSRLAVGVHGLPLMGTGDWNDGLNRVGWKGAGESVWLAWFLAVVCRRFAPLCESMDDPERARHYRSVADKLVANTEESAWAGDRYLRAFYDDGTPLGHPQSEECKIDLNAQAWAVLAGAKPERAAAAMDSVARELADAEHRIVKLLTPAFRRTEHDPGYIKAYPPGVRENGGQYTHAAVWGIWAALELDRVDTAYRWLRWLMPALHADSPAEVDRYWVEPYVIAADVYGEAPYEGRGGWTWYSGAAGWYYQIALSKVLGLEVDDGVLRVRPKVPSDWDKIEIDWCYRDARYRIRVRDAGRIRDGDSVILLDGRQIAGDAISLQSSGDHTVDIVPDDRSSQSPIGVLSGR